MADVKSAHIRIDLDKTLDIAVKGVRRASIFMGLGVNAALDDQFSSYQLSKITNIQLISDDVSAETLRHFKSEFRIWIEAGGLRELVETFSTYLDALHRVCSLMQAIRENSSEEYMERNNKSFCREGIVKKIKILKRRFNVEANNPEYIVSIGQARNCLTHRQGIVGVDDVRTGNNLTVSWIGIDVFIETQTGQRHSLNDIPEEGLSFADGGDIKFKFSERHRVFPLRSKLALSTRDLAEICWFYDREARHLRSSVVVYAEKIGVSVEKKIPSLG